MTAMRTPDRFSAFASLARRLGWLGLLMALGLCLSLAWVAAEQLHAPQEREAQARATLLAEALAQRIERAVGLGIPLQGLEGVQALFAQRMREAPGIAALALTDVSDHVLWSYPRAPEANSNATVVAPVRYEGEVVARLVLEAVPQGRQDRLWAWGAMLLLLAEVVGWTAAEAARHAVVCGPRRREVVVKSASEAVKQGDFSWRLPVAARAAFDERPQWLGAALREVNEQHLRIRRLVGSLRQTEPDMRRRAELDAALASATADEVFAKGIDREVIGVASLRPAHARWLGVLVGCWSWVFGMVVWSMSGDPAWDRDLGAWIAHGWLLLILGWLVVFTSVAYWRSQPHQGTSAAYGFGLLVGALMLGPGWACVLTVFNPMAMDLVAGWGGWPCVVLALAALCVSALGSGVGVAK